MWIRLIWQKYLPNSHFSYAESKPYHSPFWKSILAQKSFMLENSCIQIGNGQNTSFWYDKWMEPGPIVQQVNKDPPRLCDYARVSTFIQNGHWNLHPVVEWIPKLIIDHIHKCPLLFDPALEDGYRWILDKKGSSSIASCYNTLMPPVEYECNIWKKVWKLKIPSKMRFHLWRMCHEALPIASCLALISHTVDRKCCICLNPMESHMHVFRVCPLAGATWAKFLNSTNGPFLHFFFNLDKHDWIIFNLSTNVHRHRVGKFAVISWHIWQYRITCVFRQQCTSSSSFRAKLVSDLVFFSKLQDGLYKT